MLLRHAFSPIGFYLLFRPRCLGCRSVLRHAHDFCFSCRRHLLRPPEESGALLRHEGAGRGLVSGLRGPFAFTSAAWAMRLLNRRRVFAEWEQEGISLVSVAPRARPRREDGLPLLARAISAKLGAEFEELFRKGRHSQHGRDREARMNCEPFLEYAGPGLAGKTLLLLDDVDTTGTTLELCAYRARKAGAAGVLTYSVARQLAKGFERKRGEAEPEGEEMQPPFVHLFM